MSNEIDVAAVVRNHGVLSVARECIALVVHHAHELVGSSKVAEPVGTQVVKVVLEATNDISHVDSHKIVSVFGVVPLSQEKRRKN